MLLRQDRMFDKNYSGLVRHVDSDFVAMAMGIWGMFAVGTTPGFEKILPVVLVVCS